MSHAVRAAGDLVHGEDPSEEDGAGDDDEDLAGEDGRGLGAFEDVAPAELAVDEEGDPGGVDAGDGGGFGRGEDAAVDAAEDDDGGAEGGAAAEGGLAEGLEGRRLGRGRRRFSSRTT